MTRLFRIALAVLGICAISGGAAFSQAPAAPTAPASAPAAGSAPTVEPTRGEGVLRVEGTARTDPIGLRGYLVVGALVFALGIAVIVIRRNAIAVLMGIELLMNAAGLNFVAFSKYVAKDVVDGQVITIFLIVIAAAEAAVALAIILNIFNNLNTVTVDEADELRG